MNAIEDDRERAVHRHDLRPVSGRSAWILLGTGLLLFAGASLLVRAEATGWDERIYRAMNEVPSHIAAHIAAVLTPLSKLFLPLGITIVTGAAGVLCVAWCRSPWPIVFCAGSAAVAWLGANLAKAVAERTRPYEVIAGAVLRQQPAHGTSFPSSHTAVAFAVVLTLIPFLPRTGVVVALVYAVLIGWSRVYLGVHYPLDVVGGAGIGLAVGGSALLLIRSVIKKHGTCGDGKAGARSGEYWLMTTAALFATTSRATDAGLYPAYGRRGEMATHGRLPTLVGRARGRPSGGWRAHERRNPGLGCRSTAGGRSERN